MQKISIWTKSYIICSFFFIGKIVSQINTFILYCFLIPTSVLIPEVTAIPMWGVIYVPLATTLLKGFGTPTSAHLIVLWVLFENVLSFHRLKAAFTGIMEIGRVNEWVVTEKLGDNQKSNTCDQIIQKTPLITSSTVNQDQHIKPMSKRTQRIWHRYLLNLQSVYFN